MPATVVVVLDGRTVGEAAVQALRSAGLDVATFPDSIAALDGIQTDSRIQLLVCPVTSGRGTLTGVALLRMLRHKRRMETGKNSLRAILIGQPGDREHVEKSDEFLTTPYDPKDLIAAATRLLRSGSAAALRMTGGAIIYDGERPIALPSSQLATVRFSPRTERLLRDAQRVLGRAGALQQWRMVTRRPFESVVRN